MDRSNTDRARHVAVHNRSRRDRLRQRRVAIDNLDRRAGTERKKEAGAPLDPARIWRERTIRIRRVPGNLPLAILRSYDLAFDILRLYAGSAEQNWQERKHFFHNRE